MKIFRATEIREWDAATLQEQHISSHELMERAATACCRWIMEHLPAGGFLIVCGKGNNGGDGLALARLLTTAGRKVSVIIFENNAAGSEDFMLNRRLLADAGVIPYVIEKAEDFPHETEEDTLIECLWGTGLSRPLEGEAAALVRRINESGKYILSIDIPGGLLCDSSSRGLTVIHARKTLSFCPKLAFLMAENEQFFGKIVPLDIGLSKQFEKEQPSPLEKPARDFYAALVKPRHDFGHKGSFGQAALIAGSKGMMGAAILAARGYLQSGAGKLTCYVPSCGYEIMQTSVPEAMCAISGKDYVDKVEIKQTYDSLGCGPGLGNTSGLTAMLEQLLQRPEKMLLDADALNAMAAHPHLLKMLPAGRAILTPHPGEFDRLFGKQENDFERLETARKKASEHKVCIVLKGHFTAVVWPEGSVKFNSTGNPGMAKPGSGDVLSGILTGLLAQGYETEIAACLGVYLHGLAGDLAAEEHTQQAMTASDVLTALEKAWRLLLDVRSDTAGGE